MEHIFKVIDASAADFEINELILKRLKRNEFGRMAGISVVSKIHGIDEGLLSLSTQIKYIGIENSVQHDGLTGYYLTIFQFNDPNFFLSSKRISDNMDVLEKCFHLAEAHAYAMMSNQAAESGLKPPPMELTPSDKIKKWSSEFFKI